MMRADAVWITVCNWADAVRRRIGDAAIVPGDAATLSAEEVWQDLFSPRGTSGAPGEPLGGRRLRTSAPARFAESLVNDLRLFYGSRRWRLPPSTTSFAGTPFVWQHHDLFHNHGRSLAQELQAPLVQFVDAPIVWEADRWGVSRGPLGTLVERWGEQPQLHDADLTACVSPQVADVLTARFSLDPARVIVSPCTVNVERFANPDRCAARASLGLGEETVAVGWVGSFRRFHSVDLLLESFRSAFHEQPKLHLVLVGDGPTRAESEQFVNENGLNDAVSFLGQLSPDEVAYTLGGLDIGVLPCRSQDFHYSPLKVREYAAAGLAIVAAAVGEVTDALHADEATFVAPGAVSELASALTELAAEPARRRLLARNAHKAARSRFDSVYSVDAVLAALSRLQLR